MAPAAIRSDLHSITEEEHGDESIRESLPSRPPKQQNMNGETWTVPTSNPFDDANGSMFGANQSAFGSSAISFGEADFKSMG